MIDEERRGQAAPGWAPFQLPGGISCDPTKWCAALVIWSLGVNQNTGQANNAACRNVAGDEYPNFAFITLSGKAQAPANPLDATPATFTPDRTQDLFMSSGDQLTVDLHDTAAGFQVVIHDLTTGQSGSMTASVANQFGHLLFQPNASTCTDEPYAFHPMYSTSTPHTRVPWTAHSYNVAFSDEIGHFEYCDVAGRSYPYECRKAGVSEATHTDEDDYFCLSSLVGTSSTNITGCTYTEFDFDGVTYQPGAWPGNGNDSNAPSSILFSSPRFNGTQPYSQVGFETDLPRIEFATNPPCDGTTGANCVNPAAGANFYPIYSTGTYAGACRWQLGGPNIPGTTNRFGGSSPAEYGTSPLQLFYPDTGFQPIYLYEDFRSIQGSNPC